MAKDPGALRALVTSMRTNDISSIDEVLLARVSGGMTPQEIAKALGYNYGAVRRGMIDPKSADLAFKVLEPFVKLKP